MLRVDNGREGLSLEQMRAFLQASDAVRFEGRNREAVYSWVNETPRFQLTHTFGLTVFNRTNQRAGFSLVQSSPYL
jgi:hypothetical protein